MAWNRPTEREPGTGNREQGTGKSPFRGLVAGIIVVLGAGIAAWLMWPSDESVGEMPPPQTARQIKEVTPSAAPTNAPVEKKYSEMTTDAKLKYWKDKYGDNPPENLKPLIRFLENPPQKTFSMKPSKYSIFKYSSERIIAGLLSTEPGRFVLRSQKFDERFDRDFAEALSGKIEILDSDTEDQRMLKKAVIDTKNDLAERAKSGENPSQILSEYSKQLYELGQYRVNLQEEIFKACKNAEASDTEVSDLVNAANVMLEKKGLRPIQMPNMLVRQANLSRQSQKQTQTSNKKD